ncbi:MCE family protein [Mycolicibacterium sp. XJ1819]
MHLTRRIWFKLGLFAVVTLVAGSVMAFGYMGLPNQLFGIGHYNVTLQLNQAGGLYNSGNVTYRGSEVGRVTDVRLTDHGVEATLNLKSGIEIPSDLDAQVHSVSAVGEQYVALLPRNSSSVPLKDGDLITVDRSSIPPDIGTLLDATNRGLEAIPQSNLQTVIDESDAAVGGLGPELSRIVQGSTQLALDARQSLGELTNLIDNVRPILDSQTDSSDSIHAWASHLADITGQLKEKDVALQGVLQKTPGALDEASSLFERLNPTLPVLMASVATIAPVLVTYQPNLEQILVLLPQGTAQMQAILAANRNTKQAYKGGYLSFNLNLNLPPPCTTGFLPAQQMRPPNFEDYPNRPDGNIYCRIPQDSMFNVRGARNTPCVTRPGKRAPTVKMCESDEQYVPLNEGYNWKGDPNATLSGQGIPQLPNVNPSQPSVNPTVPPVAVAEYDPITGTYIGPDGQVYKQSNLTRTDQEQTWQSMLMPTGGE